LEESSDGVKRIAEETGFGSSESMRRAFLRHLRVSPTDYRSRFQGLFPHLNTTVKELKKN
jgi:transcriptional regulator GlxA family with amidase domain